MKKKCRVYKKLPTNRDGGYNYQSGGRQVGAQADAGAYVERAARPDVDPWYNPVYQTIKDATGSLVPIHNPSGVDQSSIAARQYPGAAVRQDLPERREGGMSQSSKFQPIYQEKTKEFLSKLGQNKQNFMEDEGTADKLAIFNAISKDMPEFKTGGNKDWMNKASKSMHRKGTVGNFTEHCGGKVTSECIEKGLNSPIKKIQDMARFAKAARSVASQQWGGSIMGEDQGQLPMAVNGMQTPGYNMTADLSIVDPNMNVWQDSINNLRGKNKRQFNRGMDRLNYGISGLADAPTRYKLGKDQALFEGQGDVDLTQFDVTGYTPGGQWEENKNGKKKWKQGNTAYLDYSAKANVPIDVQGGDWGDYTSPPAKKPVFQEKGEVRLEQSGLYPDSGVLDPANEVIGAQGPYGGMDYFNPNFSGEEKPQYQPETPYTMINENVDPYTAEKEATEDGQLELTRQSRLRTAMDDNPYLASEGILGAQNAIIGAGNTVQANRQQADLNKITSEQFNQLQTTRAGKGNTGLNSGKLQPDQYTRWGEDTVVAQDGYEVGEELELTEEKIAEMIAAGYEFY